MKSRFLAIHPLIGTRDKPSPIHLQQRSPYYWWWAYLKRNNEYLDCCEKKGVGSLATLYADFGDVRSNEFAEWWGRSEQRGARLFAEKPVELRLKMLASPADWISDWQNNSDVMVVAVNMTIGRRKLQSYFSHLLEDEHKGRRGRIAFGTVQSTALYPLYRNFTISSLKLGIDTYDAWIRNQQLPTTERLPLWAVGECIGLVKNAMPQRGDTKYITADKHNVMTVAVSRYVKQAKAIITNTSLGLFPKSTL